MNKKVIGLMKDELGGAITTKFVALRPKRYSFRKHDGAEDKKCKGMKKCVVKKTLSFDDYKNCLLNPTNESVYRSQLMFRSKKHKVHMTEVNKVALNKNEDKQIAKKDGISTLARGHKFLCWSPLLWEVSLSWETLPMGNISTNSECNQEEALYPQELTSALLIPMLSQVNLLGSTSHDYQSLPQFLSICKFP